MKPSPTPIVAALAAYDPGHDLEALRARAPPGGLVELGSNENAFGPCAGALAVVRGSDATALRRYPDPHARSLKSALAAHHGVTTAEIALGNGSHELLMQFAQAYAGLGDEVLYSQYGFAVYAIAAASVGATGVAATARPADDPQAPRGHDLDAFAAALTPRTRLAYLANPNNPTGTAFTLESFERFLSSVPTEVLVVVDEAYVDYAEEPGTASVLSIRDRFPNLVVTRTFSKIHALAGLRVGYAVADEAVVLTLERLRETFNINVLAQEATVVSLSDSAHLDSCRIANLRQRQLLTDALRSLGLGVARSRANFVLVDFEASGHAATVVERALLDRGLVVRPMHGYGLPQCLRITVGTDAEQARLLDAMREALS